MLFVLLLFTWVSYTFLMCLLTPSIEGSYNGWIEDHKTSGPPFVCNVSLIETACHLCGDVKAVGGTYSENEDSFHATAHLETPDKRFEHFINITREMHFLYFFFIIYKLANYSINFIEQWPSVWGDSRSLTGERNPSYFSYKMERYWISDLQKHQVQNQVHTDIIMSMNTRGITDLTV